MSISFENPNTGIHEDFLYQWDIGIKMYVDIKNVENKVVAMFWKEGSTEALQKELHDDGTLWSCTIPDVMMTDTRVLNVSIVYTKSTNHRRTVQKYRCRVIAQAKPAGYISTDDPDYITITGFMDELKETVEFVEGVKQSISEFEQTAEDALNNLSSAEDAAKESMEQFVRDLQLNQFRGPSGIYIGEEPPTDPDVPVWLNPNGATTQGEIDDNTVGPNTTWSSEKIMEMLNNLKKITN